MRSRMSDPPPGAVGPRLAATERLVARARLPSDATRGRANRPGSRRPSASACAARTLCVRFDGRDDGVVATLTERDAPLWQEDVFEVFLAPEDPPRLYYEFEVNPLGTLFDARVSSPDLARATMRVETAWDCAGFAARVTRAPGRWSASLTHPPRAALRRAAAADLARELLPDRSRRRRTSTRRGRPRWRSRPTFTCRAGSGRCGFRSSRLGVRPLHDPLLLQPLDRPLPRPPLLELEEVRFLLRVARAAPRGTPSDESLGGERGPRSRRQASSSQCAAKSSRSPRERSPCVARQRARSAGSAASCRVAVGVLHEDLHDVAGLPVEEMRDLLGAVLEGDHEPLPVDLEPA